MADSREIEDIRVDYGDLRYQMKFEIKKNGAAVDFACYVWNGNNIIESSHKHDIPWEPEELDALIQEHHGWAREKIDRFNDRHRVISEAVDRNLEPIS